MYQLQITHLIFTNLIFMSLYKTLFLVYLVHLQQQLQMKYILILLFSLSVYSHIPVIGIYSQDSKVYPGKTYIRSTNTKYIESGGAIPVPIHYKSSQQQLLEVLNQVNGVLFPGGNITINIQNLWTKNADFILKYAIQQNKKGRVFPLYGICQGHQLLIYLTSGYDIKYLQHVRGQLMVVDTLQIFDKNAYVFANWTNKNFQITTSKPGVMYEQHHWGVYLYYFNSNAQLKSFWNLVAISTSSFNQTFVAMTESKEYPFYTTQFHAEQNMFNLVTDEERNNIEAVEVAQKLILAFVQKARMSPNRFKSKESLHKSIIYNYNMSSFDHRMKAKKVYIFD